MVPPMNFAVWHTYISGVHQKHEYIDDELMQEFRFWEDKFQNVTYPPILEDNLLIIKRNHTTSQGAVRAGERSKGTTIGNIIVLDSSTGDTVWQSDVDVVSNVALDGSTLFFLTPSAELVALDMYTGQVVGSVQFMAPEIQLGEDSGFFVAAADDTVFTYLGDSRQLFSFHFGRTD